MMHVCTTLVTWGPLAPGSYCGHPHHVMPENFQSCPGCCPNNPFTFQTTNRNCIFHSHFLYTTAVMGLTDSKIAAEVVSKACSNAEKSGKDDIKAVLTNPKVSYLSNSQSGAQLNWNKVLDLLHSLWSNLPDTTKRKINPGMAKRNVDGWTRDNCPKKVQKLRKSPDFKIALIPDFMVKVSTWTEDLLSFFNEGKSQLELTRSPFNEINTYMSKLVKCTGMDTVRLQFLKVMYYCLSGCVGWTQLHQKHTECMVQTVSNSCLLAWVNEGKRIDKLCQDIGCVEEVEHSDQYFHLGNLFHTLQDVPDYLLVPYIGLIF